MKFIEVTVGGFECFVNTTNINYVKGNVIYLANGEKLACKETYEELVYLISY